MPTPWFDPDGRKSALPPGTRVGAYTIAERLGAGGMGAVYRAHDDGGSEVALKLVHSDFDADPVARELLAQEVAALQRLRHPNVARVLDAELDASEAFIVTELIGGKTLDREIADGGPLDPVDLYELAEQLGAALLAVETSGVVHRDIKPSNIIVGEHGPVLIDFGIAREAPEKTEAVSGTAAAQPSPAQPIMGTPGYIAPEILNGEEPSAATDWWSWAAVLAFSGTGRPPFGVGASEDVFHRELQGRVDLVGLPPRTATALLGALQVDPADRTAPAEVIQALKRDAIAVANAGANRANGVVSTAVPSGHSGVHYSTEELPPVVVAPTTMRPIIAGATQEMPPVVGLAQPTEVLLPVSEATSIIDVGVTQVVPPAPVPPQNYAGAAQPGVPHRASVLPKPSGVVGPAPSLIHTALPGQLAPVVPGQPVPLGYVQQYPAPVMAGQVVPGQALPSQALPGQALPGSQPYPYQPGATGGIVSPEAASTPAYQRPLIPKRTGLIAALAVPLLLLGAQAPVVAFMLFAAIVIVLRIVGTFVNDLHVRRELAGEIRSSDTAYVAARAPLTLLRGIIGALPQLLVGLGAGILLMAFGWRAFGANSFLPIDEHWVGAHQAVVALAMLAALVLTWFGTHSTLTRYGARVALRTIAPGRAGIAFGIVAALLALYLLYGLLIEPVGAINWWPGSPPPML